MPRANSRSSDYGPGEKPGPLFVRLISDGGGAKALGTRVGQAAGHPAFCDLVWTLLALFQQGDLRVERGRHTGG